MTDNVKRWEELRPVKLQGWIGDVRFHCWAGLSEHPKAVVEIDDGNIQIVPAMSIRFLDREARK